MVEIVQRISKRNMLLELNKIREGFDKNYDLLSNEGTQELYNKLLRIKYEVGD